MKLSVIIPTYNGSKVLERSLPTWFEQDMPMDEYEVILVDNNSADNTEEIAKSFLARYANFKYIKEINPGATNARHAGTREATADILVFADNDGLFNPACLSSILQVYKDNKEVAAVTGKIELLWDEEPPNWINPYSFMLGKLNYGNEVRYGCDFYLNGGLFSIKRKVFERLHGFNPDLVGKYLIGDGDTGLVRKLHENKCLIGYTPFAEMQHLQFVDVHGTEEGVSRHFFNTGVTTSYALFRKNNFKFSGSVIRYILLSLLVFIKKSIEHIFKKSEREIVFSYCHFQGKLKFFLYLRNRELRAEIYKKDHY